MTLTRGSGNSLKVYLPSEDCEVIFFNDEHPNAPSIRIPHISIDHVFQTALKAFEREQDKQRKKIKPPKVKTKPKNLSSLINRQVYFIKSENNHVKIGFSSNVEHRFKCLQSHSPCKLELLKSIPSDIGRESRLHAQFSHLRKHGEWFSLTDELISFIDSLKE